MHIVVVFNCTIETRSLDILFERLNWSVVSFAIPVSRLAYGEIRALRGILPG